MSLSAAIIESLIGEGMDAAAILRVARASEMKADPTATERQRKCRANKKESGHAVTVTRDKGSNDRDILTSKSQVSEPDGSSPEPRPWKLPLGVSLQVWNDLLTNRKRKRLPNTLTAWKGFNDDLKRVATQTGIPPPKLIEQCTAKGWGAIYDPKETRNEQSAAYTIGKSAAAFAALNPGDEPF